MNSNSLRRVLTGMAMVAAAAFIAAPLAMAQPTVPAAKPKCGGVAGIMHYSLADASGGAVGRNFVSIPRVSPINGSPENQTNNGFHKICNRLGLPAPLSGNAADLPSIDGDGIPDNAQIFQYDGHQGSVASYTCNQIVSSSQWDEGAGVEIRPALSLASSVSLIIPGVECSQRYAVYESGGGRGINYFPIPLSTTCSERGCICDQLNLPNGTLIQTIDASLGNVENYLCQTPRALDPFTRGNPGAILASGEAARIVPPGSVAAAGAGVNCLSGLPCPATPSNDYPSPLIY
jgi:hypothetical protein